MVRRGTNSQSLVGKRTRRLRGRASTSTRRHRTSTLDCVSRRLGPGLQLGYTELTEWRLFAEKDVTRWKCAHLGDLSVKRSKRATSNGRACRCSPIYTRVRTEFVDMQHGLSNEYFPWHAFNELPHYADNWTPSWASLTNTFTSGAANTSRTTGEDTFNHEWIQVKFPQAIRVSYLRMKGTTGSHSGGFTPKSGRVYASNDGGVTWTKVSTYSGLSYASGDDYATVKLEVRPRTTTGASVLRKLPAALPSFRWMRSGPSGPPRCGRAPTSTKLQVHGSLGLASGSSLFAGDSVWGSKHIGR